VIVTVSQISEFRVIHYSVSEGQAARAESGSIPCLPHHPDLLLLPEASLIIMTMPLFSLGSGRYCIMYDGKERESHFESRK
jgi:hypothetical protein